MSLVKKELEISGMGCSKCVDRITDSLLKLPGVKTVDIDLPSKAASIEYEETEVDIPKILHQIEEVGYSGKV